MTDPIPPFASPSRRQLLVTALAASGLALPGCAAPERAHPAAAPPRIPDGAHLLFQGDSITDAGRDRARAAEPNAQPALGGGWAWLAAAALLVDRPDAGLRVHNRGVSGNKVFQLADRWDADCLALAPDLLTILIGVNDLWHTRTGGYDGTVEVYERDYTALLARTRAALPAVRLVVCEPFVLRCGEIDETWFPEFDHYRAAARRVADAHGATWVAFQTLFDRAVRYAPSTHWARDGVHPTAAGAALMAHAWRAAVEA